MELIEDRPRRVAPPNLRGKHRDAWNQEMLLRQRCQLAAQFNPVHTHVHLAVRESLQKHDTALARRLIEDSQVRFVTTCSVLYNMWNRR